MLTRSSEIHQVGPGPKLVSKVLWRILPFLLLCLVFHTLDRINIGFAALSMNSELGLGPFTFGMGAALGSVSYIMAEIPSNVMQAHYGARLWLGRIMISWGIASAATALVVGPNSYYAARFVLGLAEAGFLPGVFLYLTYWVPANARAKAMSIFLLAQPMTFVIGGLISGPILQLNSIAGLSGWQWLFIMEGLPAVLLGIAAWFVLRDNPQSCTWLSPTEKSELGALLDHDTPSPQGHPWRHFRDLLSDPFVLLLGLTYFGLPSSLTSYATWAPLIARSFLPGPNNVLLGVILAIPPLICALVMGWWGARSDRRGERKWHTVIPVLVAATGWAAIGLSSSPGVRLIGLTAAISGSFAAQGVFWGYVSTAFPTASRPVGIATVSTFGLCGAALSPAVVGWLTQETGNYNAGVYWVAALLVVTAICLLKVSSMQLRSQAGLAVVLSQA